MKTNQPTENDNFQKLRELVSELKTLVTCFQLDAPDEFVETIREVIKEAVSDFEQDPGDPEDVDEEHLIKLKMAIDGYRETTRRFHATRARIVALEAENAALLQPHRLLPIETAPSLETATKDNDWLIVWQCSGDILFRRASEWGSTIGYPNPSHSTPTYPNPLIGWFRPKCSLPPVAVEAATPTPSNDASQAQGKDGSQ